MLRDVFNGRISQRNARRTAKLLLPTEPSSSNVSVDETFLGMGAIH